MINYIINLKDYKMIKMRLKKNNFYKKIVLDN